MILDDGEDNPINRYASHTVLVEAVPVWNITHPLRFDNPFARIGSGSAPWEKIRP
jgi:hypothetical protein